MIELLPTIVALYAPFKNRRVVENYASTSSLQFKSLLSSLLRYMPATLGFSCL